MKKNIANHLYKLIILIMVSLFSFALCGCDPLVDVVKILEENKKVTDDKYWAERNVPPVELDLEVTCVGDESHFDTDIRISRCVYKFLEEGDKSSLKKMFSESVLDDKEKQIDGELDELIDYYHCLEIDGYLVESNSVYKVTNYDPPTNNLEHTYHTSFECDGDRYVLDIMYVDYAQYDEELFGLHGIRLRNRDKNEEVIVNTINSDI